MTSNLVPDHDPVMALLTDAMELIASAHDEYATRWAETSAAALAAEVSL